MVWKHRTQPPLRGAPGVLECEAPGHLAGPNQPLSPLISWPGSPRIPPSEPRLNGMGEVRGCKAPWPSPRSRICQLGVKPQAPETRPPMAEASPAPIPSETSSSHWTDGVVKPSPCRRSPWRPIPYPTLHRCRSPQPQVAAAVGSHAGRQRGGQGGGDVEGCCRYHCRSTNAGTLRRWLRRGRRLAVSARSLRGLAAAAARYAGEVH